MIRSHEANLLGATSRIQAYLFYLLTLIRVTLYSSAFCAFTVFSLDRTAS